MNDKTKLRAHLRAERRAHVAALPASTRALVFLRPPARIAALVPDAAVVGLYHATPAEAPTRGYAKWFLENGRLPALPWFEDKGAPMRFRAWHNPFDDESLVSSPHGGLQPAPDAPEVHPEIAFVPLLGFTGQGERLGQGGGHYDRWLAAHPAVRSIGLAWDCQLRNSLPLEEHDRHLAAVITPTRLYAPGLDEGDA